MTEETENLVVEMLRRIRGSVERIEQDMADVKVRLSSLEALQGRHLISFAGLNSRMDRFDERFARIERRLELVDA